jgi:hypothetical protein
MTIHRFTIHFNRTSTWNWSRSISSRHRKQDQDAAMQFGVFNLRPFNLDERSMLALQSVNLTHTAIIDFSDARIRRPMSFKPRAPSKEGLPVTVVGTFEFLEDNDTVKPAICAAGCGTNSGHSWNAKRMDFRFCIQLTSDEGFVQMTAKRIARTSHQPDARTVLGP